MSLRTMKAIRLTAIGSPLEAQEIDVPGIGEHDVSIRVRGTRKSHAKPQRR